MSTNNWHLLPVLRAPSTVRLVVIASGGSAPSEKTRPGFFEHVSCDFHRFSWIWDPPGLFFSKSGQSDQMTMPARRALKFSAQWRAIKLQIIFPKSEFSSNSWILRTLVWMSTWRIEGRRRRRWRRRRANNRQAPQPPASKHVQGPNIPFGGYPLHFDTYIYIYIYI